MVLTNTAFKFCENRIRNAQKYERLHTWVRNWMRGGYLLRFLSDSITIREKCRWYDDPGDGNGVDSWKLFLQMSAFWKCSFLESSRQVLDSPLRNLWQFWMTFLSAKFSLNISHSDMKLLSPLLSIFSLISAQSCGIRLSMQYSRFERSVSALFSSCI